MKYFLLIFLYISILVVVKAQSDHVKDSGKRVNLHFQTTYIYQYKPAFHSEYSASNSLNSEREKQNSLTGTLYMGVRLWRNGEIYINPELAGGSALSGAFGLASSTNGETYRVGNPQPQAYLARVFFKQTINIGNYRLKIEDGANQLSGKRSNDNIQIYFGKMSLADLFDLNDYSNSPRTQFLNWAIMNNAAWDYAANVRGYTNTLATVLSYRSLTYRLAFAQMPEIANGEKLNYKIFKALSVNIEIDKKFKLANHETNVRLLNYYNFGNMGNYKQALIESLGNPDIISTRKYGRRKIGIGLNADQKLNDFLSWFTRFGYNDGRTETWAYTEADRSFNLGIAMNGKLWKRLNDNTGISIVHNNISLDHRTYLSSGGLGFELGDGKLTYGSENALEVYYSFRPTVSPVWISADYQYIVNPGYNRDRGPVNVFSLRIHIEQ